MNKSSLSREKRATAFHTLELGWVLENGRRRAEGLGMGVRRMLIAHHIEISLEEDYVTRQLQGNVGDAAVLQAANCVIGIRPRERTHL